MFYALTLGKPKLTQGEQRFGGQSGPVVVEQLRHAVTAEDMTSRYYDTLASSVKNGWVKKECIAFSSNDEHNKVKLMTRINNLGINDSLKIGVMGKKVRPESLSLIGMINVMLEETEDAVRTYKYLIKTARAKERSLYVNLLKSKKKELKFLKKERRFQENKSKTFGMLVPFYLGTQHE